MAPWRPLNGSWWPVRGTRPSGGGCVARRRPPSPAGARGPHDRRRRQLRRDVGAALRDLGLDAGAGQESGYPAGVWGARRRSPEREAILSALRAAAGLRPAEVAARVAKAGGAVRFLLHKMRATGEVAADEHGRYYATCPADALTRPLTPAAGASDNAGPDPAGGSPPDAGGR